MPPKKKFTEMARVLLSPFESALLHELETLDGADGPGDVLRQALRSYARHHPRFRPEAFAGRARTEARKDVTDREMRAAFDKELAAFEASCARRATRTFDLPFENPDLRFSKDDLIKKGE